MSVTQNVTRHAVVGALVSVWGIARHQGKRDGDNLVLSNVTIDVLDDIADMPGIGCAMAKVGWVTEARNGLVFPKFFAENNADPLEKKRQQDAERKRRQRANESRGTSRDVPRDSSRDGHVTVTHREEKSRVEESKEEKKREESPPETIQPPSPPEGEPPVGGEAAGTDTTRTLLVMMLQEWNLNVAGAGFKQLRTISGARATAVRARLREPFWRDNWREGFEKLRSLTNLVGKCEFDWLVRPGNLEKVLEGQCDGWFSSTGPPAGPPMRSRFETVEEKNKRVLDEMLKELEHGPSAEGGNDEVIDVAGRRVQPNAEPGFGGGVLQCPF
jgi:hypothetical protein